VGRIDAKAHRAAGMFELKSVALEEGVRLGDALLRDIAAAVGRCARWHGCPDIQVSSTAPEALAAPLRALFAANQAVSA
jgi:uncharacterized protein YcaQ